MPPRMAAVLVLAIAVPVGAHDRPPAERPEHCSRWQGTVRGTDPSVAITVTLCPAGDGRITGFLTWASERSGTNTRTLEGTATGATLVLRDTSVVGRPNPGWRFCKVDRYELTAVDSDTITGSYESVACRDTAAIRLARVR